ncbi:hypothetical protein ASZ78_009380 [Callipepla squamata]|uniref:Uncharacterized protein n=1 Tax=Callipepla squamata TaxID=9009 RepID=A0A226N4R6_CALSU|nr:hypothetical protein ASZ78_009380 [Callipepla squamata]
MLWQVNSQQFSQLPKEHVTPLAMLFTEWERGKHDDKSLVQRFLTTLPRLTGTVQWSTSYWEDDNLVSRMFYECEDTEESDVYEDELYREESSSEQSVDSEVEFHLYSQVHYSQNLAEISSLEVTEEADLAEFTDQSSVVTVAPPEDKNIVELPDCDGQISDDPEIIVLSDTPEEDSVYKSKAQKSTSSLAKDKKHTQGSSGANNAKATECNALYPSGSDTEVSRQGPSGKLSSVGSGTLTVQEVMVIDDSSDDEEESTMSESDHIESWMLLGCSADDKDEDIMLNVEGTPVREG